MCCKHSDTLRHWSLLTACDWLPFGPVDKPVCPSCCVSLAGSDMVVCHGQVCGSVGDSQPPEQGFVCNYPGLIFRLSIMVASASSPIILFFLSVPITLVVGVFIAMFVTMFVAMVVARVVTRVVTTVMVISMVMARVLTTVMIISMTPPLLFWLCISPASPVFHWLLVVAPSPLCYIKTFVLIPVKIILVELLSTILVAHRELCQRRLEGTWAFVCKATENNNSRTRVWKKTSHTVSSCGCGVFGCQQACWGVSCHKDRPQSSPHPGSLRPTQMDSFSSRRLWPWFPQQSGTKSGRSRLHTQRIRISCNMRVLLSI